MKMKRGAGVEVLLFIWSLAAFASANDVDVKRLVAKDDDGPKPIVISPSEYFEGNDGPWSTFDLRVGDPEQDVRVIVSTASPESFVVLSDSGCSTAAFETVPADCAVSRGRLFNPNESSTWHDLGIYAINQDGVGLEANLGYTQRAEFATENLGLGLTGPSLEGQIVAGIATANPFYLGVFGLNNQPTNFSSLGNFSSSSFLTTLKDNGVIPSLSWSYTAGAKYRLKQVYGQLVLSGYDTSRLVENSASFTMAGDVTRDLVVILQSISYSGSTTATLLSEPIDIFIDSTDPYLWLPEDVCDAFEEAFGLSIDDASGLYLVNETHHTTLLNSDAEVTFRLSDVNSGGEAVRIVLPYAAFDLMAEPPLVNDSSYYFPLKRAANSTQYTLGRTFLQEAYLSADYENGVFNVSACSWVAGAKENIVAIDPTNSCSSCDGGSSHSKSATLGGGAIAGIVIGAVIGAILLVAAIIFLIRRQRKKRAYAAHDPAPDMAVMTGPVHNHNSTRTGKYFSPETLGTSTNAGSSMDNRETLGESNTGESAAAGSSQQELDGESTQIHQLPRDVSPSNREPTPIYHELGGTELTKQEPETASHVGELPAHAERDEGPDHLDSPFVSTLGSTGWEDRREEGSSDLVSPTSPVRRGI